MAIAIRYAIRVFIELHLQTSQIKPCFAVTKYHKINKDTKTECLSDITAHQGPLFP